MINHLLQTLLHNQNQFASGGLLLMLVGAVGASLRKIPVKAYAWAERQVTLTLTITDTSAAFAWFKWWFQTHPDAANVRLVDAFTPYSFGNYRAFLAPAPGRHWIRYKGRPVVITFSRTEEKQVFGSSRTESFTIKTYGRNQAFLQNFLTEIRGAHEHLTKDKPTLCVRANKSWETVDGYVPRTLESVILPLAIKDYVVQDITNFMSSRTWYEQHGIPYRRGYLLYGLPGTGKTSLINGLAGHFGLHIYVVNLGQTHDHELADAIRCMKENSIVLLEDIDCCIPENRTASADKTQKDAGTVSLSGLLNVLDGVIAPSNVFFFMTTNHIEKLDPALLRPGRCDVKLKFEEATYEQKREMYKRFFPEDGNLNAKEFINQHPSNTLAEFQNETLRERNLRLNSDKFLLMTYKQ